MFTGSHLRAVTDDNDDNAYIKYSKFELFPIL